MRQSTINPWLTCRGGVGWRRGRGRVSIIAADSALGSWGLSSPITPEADLETPCRRDYIRSRTSTKSKQQRSRSKIFVYNLRLSANHHPISFSASWGKPIIDIKGNASELDILAVPCPSVQHSARHLGQISIARTFDNKNMRLILTCLHH